MRKTPFFGELFCAVWNRLIRGETVTAETRLTEFQGAPLVGSDLMREIERFFSRTKTPLSAYAVPYSRYVKYYFTAKKNIPA